MKLWDKLKRFGRNYPPRYFIERLRSIISKMTSTIQNSGNSVWRFVLIIPLLLCIIFLQILLAIKFVLKNLFELIKFILRAIRKLLITLQEELEFYWTRVRNNSRDLADNLKIIVKKLIEVINYQVQKLGDDDAVFKTEFEDQGFIRLFGNVIFYMIIFIAWFVFGTIMSFILIFGTLVIIIPFLHQIIRVKLFNSQIVEE